MNTAERFRRDPIRVVVVTDLPISDWGLRRILTDYPDLDWVGSAPVLAQAESILYDKEPDVVLLDLDGQFDLSTINRLAGLNTDAKVLVLATSGDDDLVKRAVLAGARGVVFRSETPEVLVKALERVSEGEIWIDRKTVGEMVVALARKADLRSRDPEQMKIARLTRRERHVVEILTLNATARNRTNAAQLHISVNTLRNHLSSIYGKLEVASRSELVAYAHHHGLGPAHGPDSR